MYEKFFFLRNVDVVQFRFEKDERNLYVVLFLSAVSKEILKGSVRKDSLHSFDRWWVVSSSWVGDKENSKN